MLISESYVQKKTSKFKPTLEQKRKYSELMNKSKRIDTNMLFWVVGLMVLIKVASVINI